VSTLSAYCLIESVKQSLRILPNESALRGQSPFLQPFSWPQDEASEAPRALRALSRIIDGGLCHRCGSCIGICPTKVLTSSENSYPQISNLSACTDCDLCVKVCPGDEFDFKAHYKQQFNEEGSFTSTHGHFDESFLAYATEGDLQEKSTSGGLVTAILLHLLDTKQIDGAVCITSDKDVLWRGKPIVARTREEILGAVKSKYAISPTNEVFSQIREIPGKYALVGLPCQIHGFIKASELDPRLKERVVLTVGLFCHAAVEHDAYNIIWEGLKDKLDGAVKFTSRIGKHPGAPHITYKDGSLYPIYFGDKKGYKPSSMEIINILYRLYSPARCLTCYDASAEFADIAVGDPWMSPPEPDIDFQKGWSFALVRSARAKAVCEQLIEHKKIVAKSVTRKEALACNSMMATEKRYRAFRIIETHRRQGKAVPAYGPFGTKMPEQSGWQFVKTEINMLTHAPCFLPNIRAGILRFFLSSGGYYLLWLNNQRRTFRFWFRDTKQAIKNKLFGRR
jgi:coenzyme F420 hydrogenase subunit beta